jgi:hypothetical protein
MKTNWTPLESRLGRERCVGFMYLGRVNGINLYKHGITRSYLNLDDERGTAMSQPVRDATISSISSSS